MRKFQIVIYFLLLFTINSLFAQTSTQDLTLPSLVAGKNLFSVSTQGSNIYVAGDGCILKSIDAGSTWAVIYSDNTKLFFDVKFPTADIGYAVGWDKSENALNKIALLYKTDNGGLTWNNIFKSTRKAVASTKFVEGTMRNGAIDFLDESRLIWSVGSGQYYSATGGRGNHVVLGGTQSYSALLPNQNKAFWGSSGILESLTGGATAGISGYQAYDYYDFDLVTPEIAYACTNKNEIYRINVNQANSSVSKTILGTGINSKFYGIDFLNINNGFVVGDSSKIFYTTDGGNNWNNVNITGNNQLNDILFYDISNAIIVGNNGTLKRLTTNILNPNLSLFNSKLNFNETSTNWQKLNLNSSNDLYEVEINNDVAYVAGDGVILKSTDLGATFSVVHSNPIYKYRDITFTNANTGWVIAFNTSLNRIDVLKTTNGGISWVFQTSLTGTSAGIITGLCIEALNANYVLASAAIGVNTNKKYTTNSGATWQSIPGNFNSAAISDFVFFGNNYNANGEQGYGPQIASGGSYLCTDVSLGNANTIAGCITLTYPNAIKSYGSNAISSANGHMTIARDMDWNSMTFIQEGWFERTKVANPTVASNWACYPTYNAVNFYGVKMKSNSEIWLVGEKGTIITTKNGGMISLTSAPNPQKEWYGHNTNTYNNLYDIESFNDSIFLVVGANGTILRTTNANNDFFISSALLSTNQPSSITVNSATLGGVISSDGGSSITTRGVCWSKTANPTTTNFKTVNGSGIGSFTSNLTGLESNTIYYARAYATNAAGTEYGNEVSFKTLGFPLLSTNQPSSITVNSATLGGVISSDGGSSITTRGVCWSKTANPTTTNFKTVNGSGIGSFTSNLTGLESNTIYYARAYATNAAGTEYGNEVSFKTLGFPLLSTNQPSSITVNSATLGGVISSDGGSSITTRGVCWSKTANPTTTNFKTVNGSGIGSFTSNLTGLESNTIYYARAYATNAAGTEYGNEVSFKTLGFPLLSTNQPSSITVNSATLGGVISSDGGSSITTRGVCWSKTANPTTTNFKTVNGSGIGSFTSNLTGLESNTIYYARAYATNAAGTEYGNEVSFKTLALVGINTQLSEQHKIIVYPNPIKSNFIVKSNFEIVEPISIYIINKIGQKQKLIARLKDNNTINLIRPDNIIEGDYILEINIGKNIFNQRIIIF